MKQVKCLIPALLFLSLFTVIAAIGASCPPQEDIYPCTCDDRFHIILLISCRSGTAKELHKAFNSIRGSINMNINFECDSEPCTITASVFWNLRIRVLVLDNVELKGSLDDKSWESLSYITQLEVYRSPRLAEELIHQDLGSLKWLQTLHLRSNNMTEISNDIFRTKPQSLTSLSVARDDLRAIGDEAFASLAKLKTLWINQCKIGIVKRSMLPMVAPLLFLLDFSSNRISSLPEDMFDGMPALRFVSFASNSISQLPVAPWSMIWNQLQFINLNDNPLVCDKGMDWMFTRSRPMLLGECRYPEKMNGTDVSSFVDENRVKF